MTDFNEIVNAPVTIEIGGRKLKARRPNLEAIFGKLEAQVVSRILGNIKQAADTYGLEGPERTKFLAEMTSSSLPRGAALQEMGRESIASVEGTRLLLRNALEVDQPEISDEEIGNLVMSDPEGTGEWMAYLTGDRKKAPKMRAK